MQTPSLTGSLELGLARVPAAPQAESARGVQPHSSIYRSKLGTAAVRNPLTRTITVYEKPIPTTDKVAEMGF